jgi:hypothetical protein
MIMITAVRRTAPIISLGREQIEQGHDGHANACYENHISKNAIGR